MFECGADGRQRRFLGVGDKGDGVGIADIDGRRRDSFSANGQCNRFADRDLAHVYGSGRHLAALYGQIECADARQRFDRQVRFVGVALVKNVFSHTADAVAAHFRFTAVGIEDTHFEVGNSRRRNQNNPVRADAEMAVGIFYRQGNGIGDFAVDVQIVVSESLHFGHVHDKSAPCSLMVEIPMVISSSTSSSTCTVSSEVNMVMPFSTAQLRMATPSS